MKIEIKNYQKQPDGSKAVAFFDAYLPEKGLTIKHLKVVQGKSGPFPSGLQYCEEDPMGNKKWMDQLVWDGADGALFKIEMSKAFQEYQGSDVPF